MKEYILRIVYEIFYKCVCSVLQPLCVYSGLLYQRSYFGIIKEAILH